MKQVCYRKVIEGVSEVVLTAEANGFAIWFIHEGKTGLLAFLAGDVGGEDVGFPAMEAAVDFGRYSIEELSTSMMLPTDPTAYREPRDR